MDAKADLLIWGMGEKTIIECAQRLHRGEDLRGIPGTAWMDKLDVLRGIRPICPPPWRATRGWPCPRMQKFLQTPPTAQTHAGTGTQVHRLDAWAFEPGDRAVVLARPAIPLSTEEMDDLYTLPFTRLAHPRYKEGH